MGPEYSRAGCARLRVGVMGEAARVCSILETSFESHSFLLDAPLLQVALWLS